MPGWRKKDESGDKAGRSQSEVAGGGDEVPAEASTPGWSAIDRALGAVYQGEPPFHYGTVLRWRLGGPDPLDGISVYINPGPPEHWHFVTYGLSELYEKESPDPEVSGWGIEFTLRVSRSPGREQPPTWALNFLQNLARYVFETGNLILPGHTLDLNGPIELDSQTEIRATLFVEDRQLGPIETPNGSLTFVQVVGVTMDEYRASQEWSTEGMQEVLGRSNPLLVTDLARKSVLADPATAELVRRRAETEGSSMGGFNTDSTRWAVGPQGVRVTVGALVVERFGLLLTRRCALGREAYLRGPEMAVQIVPGATFGFHPIADDPSILHLELPPDGARALAASLRPVVGEYSAPGLPGLVIAVEQTIIRDQQGNETSRVG
jgi:suppressor of fused-like protein